MFLHLSMSCPVLMLAMQTAFRSIVQSIVVSDTHLCFVQKYVEQIRQLAMMCHQGAMGAAAADLEILVSMRVSTICPSCLLLINPHGADAVGSHMSPVCEGALANIKALVCLLNIAGVERHSASAMLV